MLENVKSAEQIDKNVRKSDKKTWTKVTKTSGKTTKEDQNVCTVVGKTTPGLKSGNQPQKALSSYIFSELVCHSPSPLALSPSQPFMQQ